MTATFMPERLPGRAPGFSLIELMVVLAVIALLVTLASPRYVNSVDRAKEAALRENLQQMRIAIDKFYADRARYPVSLEELVEQRYLRRVPIDPIIERPDAWVNVSATGNGAAGVSDVRSGATGRGLDGSAYATW